MATQMTKLREWRVGNDYTLQEVADLTGVSESMLSLVERGRRNLSPRARVTVARRLGVPIGELFEVDPVEEASAVGQ
jgi:transcriptional regulator with XRE-family HTH domain